MAGEAAGADAANSDLFGNMDAFSDATQAIMTAFEKYYLKPLQSRSSFQPAIAEFKSFMRNAHKNDEHIGLLLNPRVCIYATKFLEFLRGPAMEWIRKNVDTRK